MAKSQRVSLAALIIALIAVPLAISHRTARKNAYALDEAVKQGLEWFYGRLIAENTNAEFFDPEMVGRAARGELDRPNGSFPSFIGIDRISVSAKTIARGSTNEICVVQASKRSRYGLNGAGSVRALTDAEYQNWPHTAVSP